MADDKIVHEFTAEESAQFDAILKGEMAIVPRYPVALEAITRHRWLITPEALDTIVSIARNGSGPNYRPAAQKGDLETLVDAFTVERRPPMVNRNGVGIIHVTGPIFPRANILTNHSGASSLSSVQQEFAAAMADHSVQRIVLAMDSPGGVADGIQAFAQQIFEARGQKPVVAVSQDMAASAALWIASAADQFVVTPASINGSIGVVLTVYKPRGDSPTIEIVSSQSPKKREDPTSESGRASLQKIVDDLAAVFVESVARNRGVSVEHVLEQFGRGGIMSGADAVSVGMADRIGTIEQVIAGLSGNQPKRSTTSMKDNQEQPAITREVIAADHPAIAEAFRKEGHEAGHKAGLEAGRTEGAAQERTRIKSLDDLPHAGHEPLIAQLKADGKTTSAEAALQILNAERTARTTTLAQRRIEAPAPVKTAAPPANEQRQEGAEDTRPLETRAKEAWEGDPKLRAEFGDNYDRYLAFAQADEDGRVRIFKGKTAAA